MDSHTRESGQGMYHNDELSLVGTGTTPTPQTTETHDRFRKKREVAPSWFSPPPNPGDADNGVPRTNKSNPDDHTRRGGRRWSPRAPTKGPGQLPTQTQKYGLTGPPPLPLAREALVTVGPT